MTATERSVPKGASDDDDHDDDAREARENFAREEAEWWGGLRATRAEERGA